MRGPDETNPTPGAESSSIMTTVGLSAAERHMQQYYEISGAILVGNFASSYAFWVVSRHMRNGNLAFMRYA